MTLAKCHIHKKSCWQNIRFSKYQVDKMSIWWDVKMTKSHIDKMAVGYDVNLTESQADKMSSWQNITLTKCHCTKTLSQCLSKNLRSFFFSLHGSFLPFPYSINLFLSINYSPCNKLERFGLVKYLQYLV
jgi:hypothetical protein